jgi:uncharacterized membrane protein YidH (DUF202 family)
MANSEWHWTEGNKYALEAIKALLLINGGAAVALLAFAGIFAKEGSEGARIASSLSSSLLAFGIGALLSAIAFVFAYNTQREYGRGGESHRPAHIWHYGTYAILVFTIVAFVTGLWLARRGLLLSLTPKA